MFEIGKKYRITGSKEDFMAAFGEEDYEEWAVGVMDDINGELAVFRHYEWCGQSAGEQPVVSIETGVRAGESYWLFRHMLVPECIFIT